ncbi:sensor histidine kinase [Bacillus taeanensis]|uniref:Sensor histidine kinase n=1 Tax=Bacillus taeanensis TaxID=273032 RepID=A0A366XYY8_9BACI|nr:sensor histidine kinase [Bacillus taeanensis]RBW71137.1 sensor histidine kinase [Bacillus taeanensis]
MNLIIRQIFIGLFVAFMTAFLLLIITFLTFPLEDVSSLLEVELFEIPYVIIVLMVTCGIGLIIGIAYGGFLRQTFYSIESELNALLKGQKISSKEANNIKEFAAIHSHILEIKAKIDQLTEYSQRLATEKATTREKSLQEVVVQERNRLARELHDSVSQQLFAASMMISAINESNPPQETVTKKQLSMVETMIHQSQSEMRALLLHLRPVALKGKSLQEGIESLLSELTQKVPMKIETKIETLQLEKGIEDHLFRILQEALSNTLRHAHASLLNVILIERDETVIMRVVDNGVGFDSDERKTSSYGLQTMHERALEVGGTLKIISLKNQGTQLEVKIPHRKKGGLHH